MAPALFWFLYTLLAIWFQAIFPGPDLFAPALLLLLQQRDFPRLGWLLPLWIVIQEGSGSMYFGTSLLWYAGLILVFHFARVLLDTRGFLFIFLISVFAGFWQYLCLHLLSGLQELQVPKGQILQQSLQTIVAVPLFWSLLLGLKNRLVREKYV
ncbi:MAG: hypothetical protein ACOC43_13705 [Desulfohalobiaceae bacterium]